MLLLSLAALVIIDSVFFVGNYPPPLPGGHPSLPATPVTPVPPPSFTPGPPSFAPGPPAPPGAPNFSYNTQPQQPHTPTSPGVGFNSSPQTAGFNTTPARQSGAGTKKHSYY